MPDIQTAIVQSGLPIKPLRQRVWQILKDNGPMTVDALVARMRISKLQGRQCVSVMKSLGFVKSERLKGTAAKQYIANYSSYEEALEMVAPTSAKRRPAAARPTTVVPMASAEMPPPALLNLPPALLGMTVTQLHTAYRALDAIFGSRT